MDLYFGLIAIITSLSSVALSGWLSAAATLVHTADEVSGDGGPIWDYLAKITGISRLVLCPGYFVFQTTLIALGVTAYTSRSPALLISLAFARLADVLITHGVLRRLRSPNPGHRSAWLLVGDAVVAILSLAA